MTSNKEGRGKAPSNYGSAVRDAFTYLIWATRKHPAARGVHGDAGRKEMRSRRRLKVIMSGSPILDPRVNVRLQPFRLRITVLPGVELGERARIRLLEFFPA